MTGRVAVYCLSAPLFAFIFLASCKQKVTSPEAIPKQVSTYTEDIIALDSVFIPLIDSIPMTLEFNGNQYEDFIKWWDRRGMRESIDVYHDNKDSIHYLHLSLKQPGFQIIQSLKPPFYLRYNYYGQDGLLQMKLVADTESLKSMKVPLLRKETTKHLLQTHDPVYLFYSFAPSFNLYTDVNHIIHLIFQPMSNQYLLITLDTMENIIDSMTLHHLAINEEFQYSIQIKTNSTLQLIRHTITHSTGYWEVDSSEIKRIYIDSTGLLYDWSNAAFTPEKFCSPVPIDSNLNSNSEILPYSVPLALSWQAYAIPILKSRNAYAGPDRSLYEIGPLPLLCYQHLLSETSSSYLFTVIDIPSRRKYLVLTDKQGRIKDADDIFSIEHQDQSWTYAKPKLAKDATIYMIQDNNGPDTVGRKWVEGENIFSEGLPLLSVTMPIGNLDKYFPYHNRKRYDIDSLSDFLANPKKYKQIPDSIYKCIVETAELNEGYFSGKSYNITHTANNLTYLVMSDGGGLTDELSLFIINQENVMQKNSLQLAYYGGDSGDTWGRYGYFINDSTYHATTLNCEESSGELHQIACDSIITLYNIQSNGKILRDESKTKRFKILYSDVE